MIISGQHNINRRQRNLNVLLDLLPDEKQVRFMSNGKEAEVNSLQRSGFFF